MPFFDIEACQPSLNRRNVIDIEDNKQKAHLRERQFLNAMHQISYQHFLELYKNTENTIISRVIFLYFSLYWGNRKFPHFNVKGKESLLFNVKGRWSKM